MAEILPSFLTRFRWLPSSPLSCPNVSRSALSSPEATVDEPSPATTRQAEGMSDEDGPRPARQGRSRRSLGYARTAVASLLVLSALIAPDDIRHLTPRALPRMPVELLVAVPVLLVLPTRGRRVVAALGGVALGLLTILKVVDVGFYTALDRPFDLVLDWGLFGSAVGVVRDSVGRLGMIGVVVLALLLVAALLVLMARSALRLTGLAVRHRTNAMRAVAVAAGVWATCAALGAQVVPGVPLADRSTASLVYHRGVQVYKGLQDKRAFAAESRVDPFRGVPGNDLLTALRGKDVIVSFVESYGRSAIENPEFAPQVNSVLDRGTKRLTTAGFASRSAFLTSSTAGGGSWLAHSTLFSGLWVTNQQRYRTLTSSDRLSLPRAFKRAGWRTVSLEPAIFGGWPEKDFYGYDRGYAAKDLGYRGRRFSYATMPDQYTFSTFQQRERGPGHAPVFGEITLVSSHNPWTPIPRTVDWNRVGDGSIFNDAANREGDPPSVVWRSPSKIRAAYRTSIEYSLDSVISYVEKYGDDNLVMVFLGDHQPAPLITGAGASRDVPITIVARDRKVLDRISSWGWQSGLRPSPTAPVWRMDTFRNRFLTAFGRDSGSR